MKNKLKEWQLMASTLEQKQADLSMSAFGRKGGILITNTTGITGKFRMMVVLSDATFSVLTTNYTKNGTETNASASDWGTLPTGLVLSGEITAVTLSSGKVLLIV